MLNGIIEIAREAGDIILQAGEPEVTAKDGVGNFVTEYDMKVQEFIYNRLKALSPGAVFLGEEDEHHDSSRISGECFIVDPIDGTQNFINGYKHSCVSIGMVKDGEALMGVVYDPFLGDMFYGEKGKGAFLSGRKLELEEKALSDSIVIFGTSSYNRKLAPRTFKILRRLFDRALDLRSTGSAALDICNVAAGRAEVFFELHLSPWDYCAASIILRESGGEISDTEGAPLKYFAGGSVLAANRGAYGEALEITRTRSR